MYVPQRGGAFAFGVSEENWREAAAPAGFAVSESPRYLGRAIVALASDPGRARCNQKSVTTGQLSRHYGFTDTDGSRPDSWRYLEDAERGLHADPVDYR